MGAHPLQTSASGRAPSIYNDDLGKSRQTLNHSAVTGGKGPPADHHLISCPGILIIPFTDEKPRLREVGDLIQQEARPARPRTQALKHRPHWFFMGDGHSSIHRAGSSLLSDRTASKAYQVFSGTWIYLEWALPGGEGDPGQ